MSKAVNGDPAIDVEAHSMLDGTIENVGNPRRSNNLGRDYWQKLQDAIPLFVKRAHEGLLKAERQGEVSALIKENKRLKEIKDAWENSGVVLKK